MTLWIVLMVLGILLAPVGYFVGIPLAGLSGLVVFVVGTVGLIVSAVAGSRNTTNQAGAPIGHTRDGRPIYPVVGYTTGGAPVTADQAVGVQPYSPRTNNFAIAALILAFVIPLLAIPFGHVARAQIRRTGEQGAGLALAGLIIAYVSVIVGLIVAIAMLATLNA